MKTRHPITRLLSGVLAIGLLAAVGHSGRVTALAGQPVSNAAYCSALSTHADTQQSRINQRVSTLSGRWSDQTAKLQQLATTQDAKVQQVRSRIDAQRADNIAALRKKATTDQQKSAVDTYSAAIATAVQTRRQTVDTARATFRSGVQMTVSQHQATVSGQVQALRIGVSDAYAAAENSCGQGTTRAAVRTTLNQALQAAHQSFAAQRTSDTIKTDTQQLVTTRKAAVKAADDTFATATAAARQTLLQAFPAAN